MMDYKKIIRSRVLRGRILNALHFIPDKSMLRIQYWIKTGRRLNLKKPERFTEKLQWYKLYYKNELMPQCVNKYRVREYVELCGLEPILNELYGVYDRPEDIPFEVLPDKFVLKDTLGGREWPYMHQTPQIVVEKYLEQENGDLVDYKLFCFDGKARYIYVRAGYAMDHDKGQMAFFDRDLNYLRGVGMDYCAIAEEKPQIDETVLRKMIGIADRLSNAFPHVRVDLYEVNKQIFFGELTFFNASGYMRFEPDAFDYELGKEFILPEEKND